MDTDNDRKKIFLVDDIDFSLLRSKQFLKDYYSVFTINSSEKMFELLENVTPDLILLDINMPDVDGYETLEKLKADERYAEIPVIFLSGKDDEDSIIKGLGLGAVDHVPKPYTPKDLVNRISIHLYPITYQDELRIDTDKNVSKQSVLAVGESQPMLRSIHFALHNRYKVHTLQKPENLKKILKNLQPDLFLLDYDIPGEEGLEHVRIIREFTEFKEAPVILLVSEGSPEFIKEARMLGCSDCIEKPFNPRKLRDSIAKCLVKNNF